MTARIPSVRFHTILCILALAVGCGSGDADTDEGADPRPDTPLQYSPIVVFQSTQFEGFPVRYYVPPEPKALVWAFHGTNGSIGYIGKIETIALLNELILEDIAFVATESTEQGADNQWDQNPAFDENLDLQRLFRLREHMYEITALEPGTPEFAFGFSNGGGMSGIMAKASLDAGIDFRATAPHLSGGNAWGLDLPVIWLVGVNDPQPSAEDEAESRIAAGIPTELHHIPVQTITPDYFTKNPNVSPQVSEKTWSEMVRLGMIDEAGNMIVPGEEGENWIHKFEQEAKVASPTLRSDEIRVAWALHRMNSYYAHEVRDFFLRHL